MSADGATLVSCSSDQTIKVWDLATGQITAEFTAEEWLTCCAICPRNKVVVAGEYFGLLHFLTLTGRDATDS